MTFFDTASPVLQFKQTDLTDLELQNLDLHNLYGSLQIQWRLGNFTVLNSLYTQVDQSFLIWGAVCFVIFTTAQFSTLSWEAQAQWGTGLTAMGTGAMVYLSYHWSKQERVRWMMYAWAGLMGLGVGLTDWAIATGWGPLLMGLCPLWLGLCALGYGITGWGLRSRALVLAGVVHGLTLGILPWFPQWQWLITGLVMGFSLWVLAELRWDMRPSVRSQGESSGGDSASGDSRVRSSISPAPAMATTLGDAIGFHA
jgi:hypothetical protein